MAYGLEFLTAAARAGHEARRGYMRFTGSAVADTWEDLPPSERLFLTAEASMILSEHVNASTLHERSVALAKEPLLVAWADLPIEVANGLRVFVAVVKAFAEAVR